MCVYLFILQAQFSSSPLPYLLHKVTWATTGETLTKGFTCSCTWGLVLTAVLALETWVEVMALSLSWCLWLPSKVKDKWLGIICWFGHLLLLLPLIQKTKSRLYLALFYLFCLTQSDGDCFLPCCELPKGKDHFPFWPSCSLMVRTCPSLTTHHNPTRMGNLPEWEPCLWALSSKLRYAWGGPLAHLVKSGVLVAPRLPVWSLHEPSLKTNKHTHKKPTHVGLLTHRGETQGIEAFSRG